MFYTNSKKLTSQLMLIHRIFCLLLNSFCDIMRKYFTNP
ncbi:hypothetical protein BBU72A_J0005 (plasmid) [Borreliella burgdorferi 72a]|nr:hypothetical protein BBU72A_J0005 [Borreliella burgdorferi 72a]